MPDLAQDEKSLVESEEVCREIAVALRDDLNGVPRRLANVGAGRTEDYSGRVQIVGRDGGNHLALRGGVRDPPAHQARGSAARLRYTKMSLLTRPS